MHTKNSSSVRDMFVRIPTAFAFGLAVGVLVFSMQAWAQSGFPTKGDKSSVISNSCDCSKPGCC